MSLVPKFVRYEQSFELLEVNMGMAQFSTILIKDSNK